MGSPEFCRYGRLKAWGKLARGLDPGAGATILSTLKGWRNYSAAALALWFAMTR